MADKDKYDEQTEALLPCEWLTDHGVTRSCLDYDPPKNICHTCACRPVVAAALREADRQIQEYASVIDETLRLADFLNGAAEGGAGFGEHWGERVLQAVEPLRNVKAFASETLKHNRILTEANDKSLSQRDDLRREVERLKTKLAEQTKAANHWFAEANKDNNTVEKLRAAIERLEALDEVSTKAHNENLAEMADMRAEIGRLTGEWNKEFTRKAELIVENDNMRSEIAALKAELQSPKNE